MLQKAEELLGSAERAESHGETSVARICYLQASQQLFLAAAESNGRLKEIRVDNAETLLEKAMSISKKEKLAVGSAVESTSSGFVVRERPNVSFDEVAGLDDVKTAIQDKIIYPFMYPEEAKHYGIKSGGGVLLYGPPGTGKTYIAKAVAHEVDGVFYSIKPSDVMSKWVGESEQNIAKLFSEARQQKRSVVFIDEVEALIPRRKDSGSTIMQRVVPQILAEMEGIESDNRNLLFIGATNEPWSIDHAALRPGRFDEKIYVPPPNLDARTKLFQLNLKGKPLESDVDPNELAGLTDGYSGADIKEVCLKAALVPFHEAIHGGTKRGITAIDLEAALREVKPSVSREVVERYGKFKFA